MSLKGLYAAHPNLVTYTADDIHCLVRADSPVQNKVALATGGGSVTYLSLAMSAKECLTVAPLVMSSKAPAQTKC